jgi:hypothetical protein
VSGLKPGPTLQQVFRSPCYGKARTDASSEAMFTRIFGSEEEPQRLKPDSFCSLYGTTKVVP